MLQELTGMAVSFFPTLRRGGGRFGVGIASDGPIEAEFRRLPHQGGLEPRGVIVARWSGISVVAAHLSTESGARAHQTQALAETAAALASPTVVMGNLNQRLTALKPLLDLGFSCPAHPQHTFGRRFAKRQIDFVLAGPGLKVSEWTSLPCAASDHLPLVATLQPV
jgi:endonuclease/exonuclease/phosphatase family metal-dependent hydrolase